jgi:hypothetical protein
MDKYLVSSKVNKKKEKRYRKKENLKISLV